MASMELTRREWAAAMAATPALAQVVDRKNPPEAAPTPPPPNATPQQRAAKAVSDVKQVSDALAAVEVPMSVQPAFVFRP